MFGHHVTGSTNALVERKAGPSGRIVGRSETGTSPLGSPRAERTRHQLAIKTRQFKAILEPLECGKAR